MPFMLTQRKDLPQKDSKGPNVTLCGVHPVEDGLRSHPLQRETCLQKKKDLGLNAYRTFQSVIMISVSVSGTHISLANIVRIFVDISSEAKVTDLHHIVL